MNFTKLILITIYVTAVFSKKKYKVASSESIENILYYKDCNHKQKPMKAVETPLRSPSQKQECKMCCTMCCGDQCVDSHQVSMGRQAPGINPIEPKGIPPIQPNLRPPRERRKKLQMPLPLQPPIPGRRGLGFTRENIKSLISQDEDIRKILKDLVRVTMQKVDLMEMINKKQNTPKRSNDASADLSDSENDL